MIEELQRIENDLAAEQEIQEAYRSIFTTAQGEKVLDDMLYNLYFLQSCATTEQQALCNYAKSLLATIYGQPIESSRLKNIIKKLFKRKTK